MKSQFRLAKKNTQVGDMDVPAGTTVMVCPGAVNRDPVRFENPHEFSLDRKNVREHIAFGRGALLPRRPARPRRGSGVAGAPSRQDVRHHHRRGEARPGGQRSYNYEPTFILRGLTEINIEFTPVA